jgi:hypothetical protein
LPLKLVGRSVFTGDFDIEGDIEVPVASLIFCSPVPVTGMEVEARGAAGCALAVGDRHAALPDICCREFAADDTTRAGPARGVSLRCFE